jgi:Ca2+-transporting ATPase
MGPMCSIVYENEPAENSMQQMKTLGSFYHSKKLSIIQGLVITVAILVVYQLTVQGGSEIETRTMVFTTLVFFF